MDTEKRNNFIIVISLFLSIIAIVIGILISLGKDPNKFNLENSVSIKSPATRVSGNDSIKTTAPDNETDSPTQSSSGDSSSQSSQATDESATAVTPIEEKTVYSLGANFRDAPNLETSKVISYLDKGTEVIVVGIIGEWYFGKVNGVEGYVHKDVVESKATQSISPTAAPVSTRAPIINSITNTTTTKRGGSTPSSTATTSSSTRTSSTSKTTPEPPTEPVEQTTVPTDTQSEPEE